MTARILTDSTSDLGMDIESIHAIEVIPLHVTIGDEVFLDRVEIDQEKLFHLVEKVGSLPKTAAPSIGEFEHFFARQEDILFIGISSKLSATMPNALLAVQEKKGGNIRLLDSLNLSTGIGLLVLRAAELCAAGKSLEEIYKEVSSCVPRVRTSFLIDTMDYLYKGGRCSALQAIAGSVLKIHPIIEVRHDGTLGVKSKARGSRQKGLQLLLEDFLSHKEEIDLRRVFITHTAAEQDAQFLRGEIMRQAAPEEVLITRAGSVIASHCGPGTIGMIYLLK